ncbi:NAD-dependent dehydratase [Aureimonas sp. Leaf454]|uniref:NAD(P)H-binding protein n=1 Tax=Aureimonas sp. Leaf454 TaxID=1736381 RepID=UPI0006FEBE2B|nr:NAD(P)H-binding protein [Aureimonas sp. Leaf454]KQT46329.1 NAD-dependent dehydratase [Aureimonas sp. Leaf454]
MRLLLLGATGLVGRHVLELALRNPRVSAVTAPVRRPLAPRDKLQAPPVDFEALPLSATWWGADAVVCALGTTRAKAGSAEAFRRFDRDLVLEALALARSHGTPTLALVSAAGADAASFFLYPRVKGETERGAAALGFASLTILRPALIGGERSESRPVERAAAALVRRAGPILPGAWRVNPAERIAFRLVEAALTAAPGHHVVPSAALT